MEKFSLDNLKKEIDQSLEKQAISGRSLLDRFLLIDENSKKSPPYADPKYTPFYYYLGRTIKPKAMMEIGFDLGLLSSSFLLSCKTIEDFFGFKEDEKQGFFSNRIGISNIKRVYKKEKDFFYGELFDKRVEQKIKSKKWDLVIINEEKKYDKQLVYLETAWEACSNGALIVIEYIKSHKASKEAFKSFTKNKDSKYVTFETRYGTALIQKN